ncbi:dihydrofolate reductase family protein [Calothrix sp. 336/3]|uniref:dihydrofolate reductase family protein n=1 Tax=Calothrix sp. 336/3 TaxID=1337936 RepID=UPI0004E43FB4|nr:dihydrofolate reductase family protein [Calothrix sp. 336/3]AKG20781.1 hypothetical protein IJ00_05180 [Calothrix sp. 336/3]
MRKIVYHVATTVDNYIAHTDGSIDGFLQSGAMVDEYLASLSRYDTVFMGRKTYEFGYKYGLQPGQPAYGNMKHYIFSQTLNFPNNEQVEIVKEKELEVINILKQQEGKDIYLCGGGIFAGFLLDNCLIDEMILKVNPIIFGCGIKLFGDSQKSVSLCLVDSKPYEDGGILLTYKFNYS